MNIAFVTYISYNVGAQVVIFSAFYYTDMREIRNPEILKSEILKSEITDFRFRDSDFRFQ